MLQSIHSLGSESQILKVLNSRSKNGDKDKMKTIKEGISKEEESTLRKSNRDRCYRLNMRMLGRDKGVTDEVAQVTVRENRTEHTQDSEY